MKNLYSKPLEEIPFHNKENENEEKEEEEEEEEKENSYWKW